ncbi:MAG TPA: PEP-CTERM sorting domain-containing protein [Tepidisphaeraceae bacterium]|nr:PEP-CTERM sorting domain-containing protein [Tepidisphaeraceae bacterium]
MASLSFLAQSRAQSPSVLYTWDNTGNAVPNIEQWFRNFGAANTAATLNNTTPGTLSIVETGTALGGGQAFTDDFNRIRESSTSASGGLDLTGLQFMEFDIGHNGTDPIAVQFFTQASTAATFVALGPDVLVTPGVNTYSVPLAGLTADQQVYMRTVGFNIRDHTAQGNLTWQVAEVRSAGVPLAQRNLATFDNGTAEGGLQGMLVNFDGASVLGNTGQNQTGLSHNASGSGSVQWTDVAGGAGAAVSIGNGTALNGNTFNNRDTDLSNYTTMLVRISATDAAGGGGTIDFNTFFQANGFAVFESPEGGATRSIPIDGQFHDFVFSLAGLTNMNVVEQTGINLVAHPQTLTMNVDLIQFNGPVPEPTTLLGLSAAVGLMMMRRRGR